MRIRETLEPLCIQRIAVAVVFHIGFDMHHITQIGPTLGLQAAQVHEHELGLAGAIGGQGVGGRVFAHDAG